MSDGRNMNDDSELAFDHAGKESAVQANGGEQIDLQYPLPVLVGEHLESACFCFCSADIVHQDVESTPLSLNAIDDVLDTKGRSDIRLDKESRILAVSCLRSRGGGHRGTAQRKAACNRLPYTLRATGHENSLAFELIAKNGKWIAVCHGPSKRNGDSKDVLLESFYLWPPFAKMVSPVSQPASSEARNTATRAMSSGWPTRPNDVLATICFLNSGPMTPAACVPSVSAPPGLRALTRIFLGPNSFESTRVKPLTALFDAT